MATSQSLHAINSEVLRHNVESSLITVIRVSLSLRLRCLIMVRFFLWAEYYAVTNNLLSPVLTTTLPYTIVRQGRFFIFTPKVIKLTI